MEQTPSKLRRYLDELTGFYVVTEHEGKIDEEQVNSTLAHVDSVLEKGSYGYNFRKRVYNILVEDLQNLYHHADTIPPFLKDEYPGVNGYGIFRVALREEECRITTGNFVTNEQAKMLRERIDELNEMNLDELRTYYRQVLNNQVYSLKGGGGLGFIDMRRKSRQALQYRIQHVNEAYSFFLLLVTVASSPEK